MVLRLESPKLAAPNFSRAITPKQLVIEIDTHLRDYSSSILFSRSNFDSSCNLLLTRSHGRSCLVSYLSSRLLLMVSIQHLGGMISKVVG